MSDLIKFPERGVKPRKDYFELYQHSVAQNNKLKAELSKIKRETSDVQGLVNQLEILKRRADRQAETIREYIELLDTSTIKDRMDFLIRKRLKWFDIND